MRLYWSFPALALSASAVTAFAPATVQNHAAVAHRAGSALRQVVAAGPDVKAKQDSTLEKLKAKDAASHAITKDVSVVCFIYLKLYSWIRGWWWWWWGVGVEPTHEGRERPGTPEYAPPRAGTLSGATGILDRGLFVFNHPPLSVSDQFRHFLSVSFFFRTLTLCSKTTT